MRILTVPNWSFGRDSDLLRRFGERLAGLDVHFLRSDVDHNRTVSAFSGESATVFEALMRLMDEAKDRIDLNHHVGVHPRIGGLDVCPFLPYDPTDRQELILAVEQFARAFAAQFGIPTYLYEHSEKGRHEADLPSLRRGGFGSMIGRKLRPDFGPEFAHPRLGVSVVGVRDFLVAMNVDLKGVEPDVAKDIAKQIRNLRAEGDPRFLGVRALGFPLASRNLSQVSLNLTLPDITSIDAIIDLITESAAAKGRQVAGSELIGVIRRRDLLSGERLPYSPQQVVDL